MIIGEDEASKSEGQRVVRLSEYGVKVEDYDAVARFCEELVKRTGLDIICLKE